MGLREKQFIRKVESETLPALQAELKEITAGGTFSWEIVWDSFDNNMQVMETFEYIGLRQLKEALEDICYNDLGQESVREGLKTIKFQNFPEPPQVRAIFTEGTLFINGSWGNPGTGYPPAGEIRRVLEDGL
jgi:hypothetical protein